MSNRYVRANMEMASALRRHGRDDHWNRFASLMRGGGWKEGHQIGNYNVDVYEAPDEIGVTMVYIWDKTHACIFATIDKKDGTAVLQNVAHSPGCTVTGAMVRGEGTIEMIQFTLILLKQQCARVVELQDESSVRCNGKRVDLAFFSIVRHGKTWYERHFGFHPVPRDRERYEAVKALVAERPDLGGMSCDTFTPDFVATTLKGKQFHNILWMLELSA